jgi:hypothetical protein
MAETILTWLGQVQQAPPEEVWWRVRHYLYFGRVHLVIGVTNQNRAVVREAFGHLVRLRHVERGERSASQAELITVGVLLQPRSAGGRPWDTTAGMVEGPLELSPEEREALQRIWGSIDDGARRAAEADAANPFGHVRTNAEQ